MALAIMGQMVVMFFLMGIGVLAKRQGVLRSETVEDLSKLLLRVISPAVIIKSMQQPLTDSILVGLRLAGLGFILLYLLQIGVCHLVFARVQDLDQRRSAIFGAIYANCGFIGLPLASTILGDQGVFYAVLAMAVYNLFCWTHGIGLFHGQAEPASDRLRRILFNPNVLAMLLGFILFFSGWHLPSLINSTLTYLGGANTPLSMLVIGYQLAQIRLGRPLIGSSVAGLLLLRNLLFPLAALFLFRGLGLVGEDYAAALLLAACPAGSMAVFFTLEARGNPDYAVIGMGLSTLASVLSLPFIFWLSACL